VQWTLPQDAVVFKAFDPDDLIDPNGSLSHVESLRALKLGAPRGATMVRVMVRVIAINPQCAVDICRPRIPQTQTNDTIESNKDTSSTAHAYDFGVWLADNTGCLEAVVRDDEAGNDGTNWMAGLPACDLRQDQAAGVLVERHLRKLLQPMHWVDCLLASCPTACGDHFRVIATRPME
jgi:hypothetical protein